MDNNKSARNSLIIGVAITAVMVSIFAVNYAQTKKSMEHFNAVLGKDEAVDFSQVVETILNDNKIGTTDEYIRYTVQASTESVIEIRDRMFATHVGDVYMNTGDYVGKTIKLEGIFKKDQTYGKEPLYSVIRYGPGGCCGGDGLVGFEVKWGLGNARPYPIAESWVEATGVLRVDERDYYLYLELSSLTVKHRRGAEYVRQ